MNRKAEEKYTMFRTRPHDIKKKKKKRNARKKKKKKLFYIPHATLMLVLGIH